MSSKKTGTSSNSATKESSVSPSFRHLLVAPCVFFHIYSYILTSISFSQYVVYAIKQMRYPNDTDNFSSNETRSCGGSDNINNTQYMHQQKVQEEAALFGIYQSVTYCIPAVGANLIFGAYIDRFGRKLLFITSLVGSFSKCFAMFLGMYFELNIYNFIVFIFLEGLTGMWVGTLLAAFSYVADITKNNKNRSFAIALMEMCLGVGAFCGSVTSGYIIKSLGYIYTVGISAACILLDILLVIFLLPETSRKPKSLSVGVFQNIKHALSFYIKKNISEQGKRWKYITCLFIFCLMLMANIGSAGVRVLYLLNTPFCWDSVKIGWYGAINSASHQFCGMAMIKILQYCLAEGTISMIGSVLSLASLIFMGLASSDVELYIVVAVGIGSIMPIPMVRGIMSKMTPADKQGSMFAGLAAMEAICNLAGNLAANGVYSATVSVYKGLVFFVMGSFVLFGMVFNIVLIYGSKQNKKELLYEETINVKKDKKGQIAPYGSFSKLDDEDFPCFKNGALVEEATSTEL